MSDQTPRIVSFGAFELETASGELRKAGKLIKLAPQPGKILTLLVSRPGEIVTREEIQREIWDEGIFVDFDLGLNHCIRQIRAALGDDAQNSRFVETISRRGYRFKAPLSEPRQTGQGLETAEPQRERLPAAARPENGPDSNLSAPNPAEKPDVEAGRASSLRARRLFPNDLSIALVAAVALAAALAAVLIWRRSGHASQTQGIRSLAVLPFESLSRDPSQKYFAYGMTDVLITDLAQIRSLRVVSRTSVMQYAETREPLSRIARELGVDAVVEGTVAQSGGRVRINAQLVRASPEEHLWARSYARKFEDVLALQGEVAEAIAAEIQAKVTAPERAQLAGQRPENSQAQELYFKGRYYYMTAQSHWDQAAAPLLNQSIQFYEQAIAADPNYALPYAGLAIDYNTLLTSDTRGTRPNPQELSAKSRAAALKAIEIDPANAEAHAALAWTLFVVDWDWAGAESEFRRALSLSPSFAGAHHAYAMWLSAMGQVNDAEAEVRAAEQFEPASPRIQVTGGWVFYHARRYDDAIREDRAALALDPGSQPAHYALGWAYVKKHMFKQAAAEFHQGGSAPQADQETVRAYFAYLNAVSGQRDRALSLLESINQSGDVSLSPYVRAKIYAALGDRDKAFACLEEGYQGRYFGMVYLAVDPDLDPLRSDPRFLALLRRLNLPE